MIRYVGYFVTVASAAICCFAADEPHWAFVPLKPISAPEVKDAAWCRTPIDRFIRAAQEVKGLKPMPIAEPEALVRRVTFDLTGLPPTPTEVDVFLADARPDAYRHLVERLLASPHYGERWGRFWLDAARYADSNGSDENYAIANAWRYRDWVISSMNDDLPFDQFIRWQIAGDLLPQAGVSEVERMKRLTATGYLVLGPKMLAEQDKEKLLLDVADEQLDTIGRGVLGMTFGCARCHDHKTDPISQREYSAMIGILRSTKTMAHLNHVSRWNELQVATQAELDAIDAHKADTAANNKALKLAVNAANDEVLAHRRAEVARYFTSAGELLAANDGSGLKPQAVSAIADRDGLSATALREWLQKLKRSTANLPAFATTAEADQWLAEVGQSGAWLTTRRPGRVGAALHCRDRHVVDVPHAPELEPKHLSIEAWVRIEAYPGGETGTRRWIVNKNDDEWAKGHYALTINDSAVGAYLNPEGGRENTMTAWSKNDLLKLNHWHHLAMTYNGAALRVFLDGKKVAEKGGGRPRQFGNTPLRIGARQDDFVYFDGDIDEVALYGRALSTKEVLRRFKNVKGQPPEGLIRRWQFEPTTDAERRAVDNGRFHDVLFGKGGALSLPKEPRSAWTADGREKVEMLEATRDTLAKQKPSPAAMAPAVSEGKPVNLPIFQRGDHMKPDGEPVPRGFPAALSAPDTLQRHAVPETASGRLQFADWLTAADNPLTARVFVNRIWQAYFGNGLVRSSQNFGTTGTQPTHPELLDYLAMEFMNRNWSMKELHRQIVTSSVYRTKASGPIAADSENRYVTHMPRRRLEAEMVRDAVLFVAGDLDISRGGSLLSYNNKKYVPKNQFPRDAVRRSVYLPVIRDRGYDVLETFDAANAAVCTSRRQASVVAQQALFFLNSTLARRHAHSFARSLLAHEGDAEARLHIAWRRAFGRRATAAELKPLLAYLAQPPKGEISGEENTALSAWTDVCQVLFAANEFTYLD